MVKDAKPRFDLKEAKKQAKRRMSEKVNANDVTIVVASPLKIKAKHVSSVTTRQPQRRGSKCGRGNAGLIQRRSETTAMSTTQKQMVADYQVKLN